MVMDDIISHNCFIIYGFNVFMGLMYFLIKTFTHILNFII